nr:flagellin [uncultured Devosia sp.]
MVDINLSKAVRSNLSSLQSTATLMNKTSDRLSTGNKVNSALDNPTNFFTASSLNSRAGDLNQLMDSMANGIKTIEAADNGLSSITKTLESMQSTLRQARQDKTFQSKSLELGTIADLTTVQNMTFSGGAVVGDVNIGVNTIASNGTVSTLSGTGAYAPGNAGTQSSLSLSGATFVPPTAGNTTADRATVTGATFVGLTGAETSSFAVNGTTVSLTATNAGTIGDAEDAIQLALGNDYTVSNDNGRITIAGLIDGTNNVNITAVTNSGTGTPGFSNGNNLGEPVSTANPLEFSVNGRPVSLTAANAGTLGDAVTAANTQLGADSAFEAFENGTQLGIREKIANGAALTISGADVGQFTGPTNTGTAGDRLDLTINGRAIQVAGGTALGDAVTSINGQLGAGHAFEAFADNGALAFREKVANGATLTIAGTDAAAVFGSASNTNTGTAATVAAAKTVDQLVRDINDHADLKGKVRASNDNGKLRIENMSTAKLDVDGLTDGKVTGGAGTTKIDENTVRADLAKQFNELRDQLDKLSDDASFNGINLLRGDKLTITFNETGTSSIDIQAKGEDQLNAAKLNVFDIVAEDLDSDSNIDTLLTGLKTALNEVRSQSSAFGSNLSVVQNRQDFTQKMINTLETGAGNLTLADMNQEAANMMALQTRQSLASSTLSMANQADQGVLQLLR